jgi:hypothetical protein
MRGAIPPLPQYASWCGAQLKAQGQPYLCPHISVTTVLPLHNFRGKSLVT